MDPYYKSVCVLLLVTVVVPTMNRLTQCIVCFMDLLSILKTRCYVSAALLKENTVEDL
jgi:hypothetical protein